jgi:hypothetical protein
MDFKLTDDQLRACAKAGAAAAMERWDKMQAEQRKAEHDKRLQNVKVLLANYHKFKELAENAVYNAEQAEELIDLLLLMWDPSNKSDAIVESIKRSALRTNIIVTHVDAMLSSYRNMVYKGGSAVARRRFDILWDRYIAEPELSVDEIAAKYAIESRTVYDDIDIAADNLASIMFGVDYILLK